eukprot:scaffold10139_cov74-Cyclotella_meneghiniana.AAC.18
MLSRGGGRSIEAAGVLIAPPRRLVLIFCCRRGEGRGATRRVFGGNTPNRWASEEKALTVSEDKYPKLNFLRQRVPMEAFFAWKELIVCPVWICHND